MSQITFEQVRNDPEVRTYIERADAVMVAIGYTEHSFAHVTRVADTAARILAALGFSQREQELARIAAFLHDIGNIVNRQNHAHYGAVLAYPILQRLGADPGEIAEILSTIGHHDESSAALVSTLAAAVIIGDKTDVRRSRVRQLLTDAEFDMHDRVNYSVRQSQVSVDGQQRLIVMDCQTEPGVSSVVEFFQAFLPRMILCQKAAEKLGVQFRLSIDGTEML
ncbi:MAG: HD domain-containing protein [Clostridiales bacterium]|nr:HD domain-containing protein [Clostridiales bacterium]